MIKALGQRLARLEQQAQSHAGPTQAAATAAYHRLQQHVLVKLDAQLTALAPDRPRRWRTALDYDNAQRQADVAVIAQWEQARGIMQEPQVVRGQLVAHLATLRTRYERALANIPAFMQSL